MKNKRKRKQKLREGEGHWSLSGPGGAFIGFTPEWRDKDATAGQLIGSLSFGIQPGQYDKLVWQEAVKAGVRKIIYQETRQYTI